MAVAVAADTVDAVAVADMAAAAVVVARTAREYLGYTEPAVQAGLVIPGCRSLCKSLCLPLFRICNLDRTFVILLIIVYASSNLAYLLYLMIISRNLNMSMTAVSPAGIQKIRPQSALLNLLPALTCHLFRVKLTLIFCGWR